MELSNLNTTTNPALTRKEEQLLSLLERNPGRCFSRSYLLETIWGYTERTRTRTVDVHVSRLRKKLDFRGDVTIHTVVKQGYVLERRGERTDPLDASSLPHA